MSLHRHNAQRDANEPAIVLALQAAGCFVQRLSDRAVPDLLVWTGSRLLLLEVKNRTTHAMAKKSTGQPLSRKAQGEFITTWQAAGAPVHVVHSPAEALAACGLVVR